MSNDLRTNTNIQNAAILLACGYEIQDTYESVVGGVKHLHITFMLRDQIEGTIPYVVLDMNAKSNSINALKTTENIVSNLKAYVANNGKPENDPTNRIFKEFLSLTDKEPIDSLVKNGKYGFFVEKTMAKVKQHNENALGVYVTPEFQERISTAELDTLENLRSLLNRTQQVLAGIEPGNQQQPSMGR